MAESGHGVAVIPSGLRTDRHRLRIVAVTYRGKPLREHLAIYWDKRRPLLRYATGFSAVLAAPYARGVPDLETYHGLEDVAGKARALNSR